MSAVRPVMAHEVLEVLEVGGSALVQDLGRPGLAHLGVPPSGAADRAALVAGNRLLGNPPGAAGLEVIGGLRVRATADLLVALTGALGPVAVDDVPAPGAVLGVPAGSVLSLATPRWGLRTYLTVRGGLATAPVLGSRATDVLSGLGPAPVRSGDRLAATTDVGPLPTTDAAARRPPSSAALVMLDTLPGPRAGWVGDPGALYARPWRVSPVADRVGVRLLGEPLERAVTTELASEGVVTGSVQLPPGGEPVILGPDHPVTGGYPVIAVLTTAACDAVAQLRTGTTVRFRHAPAR